MSETFVKIEPAATRLGNWMFQYAAAKTAEPESEVVFVVPEDQMKYAPAVETYWGLFGGARIEREGEVRSKSEEGRSKDDVLRVGLYQDAKYVDRELCRKMFLGPLAEHFEGGAPIPAENPRSGFEGRAERAESRRPRGRPLPGVVSIHVRRGDYMRLPHRHPFVGKQYLRDAVARFPGAEFLVFSDDIAWCKRFFRSLKPRFHFAEGNDVLTDLYLMTQCTGGHICSNSTFSWWGAYLGEGRTIFPSMWYGMGVKGEGEGEDEGGVFWKGMYFAGSEVVENGYTFGLWLKAVAMMGKEWAGRVWRKLRRGI